MKRICYWCNNPIRKNIALNDASDAYCSNNCWNKDKLNFDLEWAWWLYSNLVEYL